LGLSVISLADLIIRWGIWKMLTGIPEAIPDKTAQLLQKMEEITRLVKQLQ